MQSLPPIGRLFVFAVLLPAAVAGSNQLLFELAPWFHGPMTWLYWWMALSTALLSWFTGRYLSPVWLRWSVFAWSLILLDMLTIAACLTHRIEMHFGHTMVAAQISLIVLWAVLASTNWQWRLPVGLVAAAALIVFGSTFRPYWGKPDWNLLMIVTSLVLLLVCCALRFSGFGLHHLARDTSATGDDQSLKTNQFGLKHMLIWATALVPILLVLRGLDLFVLKRLGAPDVSSFAFVALVMTAVNLIAIWAVLGEGHLVLRLAALLVVPYSLGVGTSAYLRYIESTYRTARAFGQSSLWIFRSGWYDSLVREIADDRESLVNWLCLNAALLAALLLFLRADGYRLAHKGEPC